MIRRLLLGCVLPLTVLCAGCGYTTGSLLPSNYHTVAVEPFKNKVGFVSENTRALYIPQLETKVRSAITDRYLFDGNLKIAPSERADVIVKGDLTGFYRDELRLSENQDVQEYRIRITIALTIIDAVTGEEIANEPSFSGEATYFTTGARATSESDAVQEALTDLARRVVERTIENW